MHSRGIPGGYNELTDVIPVKGTMSAPDLHGRLRELNQKLERMGASEEYCRTFFDSGAGVCEAHYAGVCVEHRTCVVQLPQGMMCERR